jgi:hypothetical protein
LRSLATYTIVTVRRSLKSFDDLLASYFLPFTPYFCSLFVWTNNTVDYVSSVANSTVIDDRGLIMDGCRAANERGVEDLVFTDVDGSFDLTGQASGGALVSNFTHMTDIFGGSCVNTGNCMAYCPGVCLRTMSFKVEQFGTENWKLQVRAVPSVPHVSEIS